MVVVVDHNTITVVLRVHNIGTLGGIYEIRIT